MKTLSEHQDFLLKRASQNQTYMAYSLMSFVVKNDMKVSHLQDELACDSDSLLKLALCRGLAFGDSNFQQGIQQIAGYTGIDTAKLASLLKRIAMQMSFSQVNRGSTLTPYSFVAAAREKEAPPDSSQLSDDK